MFDEDLDIGLSAEDAYAAYITDAATRRSIVPEFCSARGALVDVVFHGPFMTETAFLTAAAASLRAGEAPAGSSSPLSGLVVHPGDAGGSGKGSSSIWEALARMTETYAGGRNTRVVLHAWIEKLNGAHKIQLTEPVYLLGSASQQVGSGDDSSTAAAAAAASVTRETEERTRQHGCHDDDNVVTGHRRVLGNLDFLLHLFTHEQLPGEGSAPSDPLNMDRYDSSVPPFSASAGSEDVSGGVAAACVVRDVLERRDAVAVARNAVDAVIKFARLAGEHPGEVAAVHADAAGEAEYLQFSS